MESEVTVLIAQHIDGATSKKFGIKEDFLSNIKLNKLLARKR